MTNKKKRKIKVVHRKLGREKADGQAFHERKLIEIDPTLETQRYFEVMIHESIHVVLPKLTEKEVEESAKKIFEVLWEQGFRKVELK